MRENVNVYEKKNYIYIYICLPMYMFSYLCYEFQMKKRNVVFMTLNYVEKI